MEIDTIAQTFCMPSMNLRLERSSPRRWRRCPLGMLPNESPAEHPLAAVAPSGAAEADRSALRVTRLSEGVSMQNERVPGMSDEPSDNLAWDLYSQL